MTRHLRSVGPCPESWRHEPLPENPAARWSRMVVLSRTHDQVACPGCGLFLVWRPRAGQAATS